MENVHRRHIFYRDAFQGRSSWPFWIFGFVVIFFFYLNATTPGGAGIWSGVKALLTPGPAAPFIDWLEKVSTTSLSGVYILPILLGIFALIIAQRLARQRPLRKLINGLNFIRWRRLIFAFTTFLSVAVVFWCVVIAVKELTHRPDILEQFGVQDSLKSGAANAYELQSLAIVTLVLLPFSILVDEMIFRGYIDQAVRRFISNRWTALVLGASLYSIFLMADIFLSPGLAFEDDFPLALTQMFVSAFVFGLFLSILCDHDGGLEAAIGVGIAETVFQDFAYPKLLPIILNENYYDNFELPWAAYLQSYLFIPAILFLLIWNYGAQRDKFS